MRRTTLDEFRRLFNGSDQNKRYYYILLDALENIPEDINLGCERCDIGTHSNRKFAESTTVSKLDGPSRTQVALRAGQSVGKTQDSYFFQEDEADAFVGRTVAQLELDEHEFDVLPPHFSTTAASQLYHLWPQYLPGYESYPSPFKRVIPFLFASLVYHHREGNLLRLLPRDHPLFALHIFTDPDIMTRWGHEVIIAFGSSSAANITADGVPSLVKLDRKINKSALKQAEFHQEMRSEFKSNFMDLKTVVSRLNNAINEIPQVVERNLLDRFNIDGVLPLNMNDIRGILDERSSHNLAAIERLIDSKLSALAVSLPAPAQAPEPVMEEEPIQAELFHYDGADHRVPRGFSFPSYSLSVMWELWFFGNPSLRIGPYRFIVREHDLVCSCKHDKTKFTRTKHVMGLLTTAAIDKGLISSADDITRNNSSHIYNEIYPDFIATVYKNIPRKGQETNINTIYNKLSLLRVRDKVAAALTALSQDTDDEL